jgi:asparagine synthase (glutamine-hydrolysing)
MSGIAGIVNWNGAPVDRALLKRMTEFMAFRGPDAQEIWTEGSAGLGHALLRTTHESVGERQPASVDGETWITANARVDARKELAQTLLEKGHRCSETDPDVELILYAYAEWGEGCVEHLLGDFAFAIWEKGKRRLFCARDPLGVKPLYYAEVGGALVVSNTLDCVRMHPAVSDRLNDRAIGDYLLIGNNEDPATTSFADIQRVPPAHTLTATQGSVRLRRYWEMPIEEPLHYRRPTEYVERFRGLLRVAVSDRLRTERVGVNMSGGLDSPTVAATAKRLLAAGAERGEVCALTIVHEQRGEGNERRYARLVADFCGFPIRFLRGDEGRLFEGYEERPELLGPEPYDGALGTIVFERYQQATGFSRVLLTGEGGDPGLIPSLHYFRGRRGPSLLWGTGRHLLKYHRMPPLGFRLAFHRWIGKQPWRPRYPGWLDPAFEREHALRERWEEILRKPEPVHPYRPEAHGALTTPYWSACFDCYDPSVTRVALEVRHPLCDLRVQRFLLRVPVLPWCANKELLRAAMKGVLPHEVLRRPKTPLAFDPVAELLRADESRWIDEFEAAPELERYVERKRVPQVTGGSETDPTTNLRPLSLNFWLKRGRPFRYRCPAGEDMRENRKRDGEKKTLQNPRTESVWRDS